MPHGHPLRTQHSSIVMSRSYGTLGIVLGYDDEVDSADVFSADQQELLDLIENQDVNEVREFFARRPSFDASRG